MKIGDPKELEKTKGFARAYRERCIKNNINHIGFLGYGDTFNFTCRRSNACCRDFKEGERIILDPYDLYRLSRNRRMSTGRFLKQYADLRLDHETHIPIALLKYQGKESHNKCSFLRSYGCLVYEDRPLRCRLYPLGRISDRGVSYFNLVNNCRCGDVGNGRSWTIRGWAEESKAEPYLEFQGFLNDLYENMDRPKFKALTKQVKLQFGNALFDIDSFIRNIPPKSRPSDEKGIMRSISEWGQDFLIAQGCLDPDYDKVDFRASETIGQDRPAARKKTFTASHHSTQDAPAERISTH